MMDKQSSGRVRSAMGKVNRNKKAKLRLKRNKLAKQEQEAKEVIPADNVNQKRKRSGMISSFSYDFNVVTFV